MLKFFYLGSYFRLPLPLFLLHCVLQKRAPFKPGCRVGVFRNLFYYFKNLRIFESYQQC